MQHCPTRRHFLGGLAAAGVSTICRAANAPAAPVAIAKCKTYGAELLPTLAKMFDQIGGLGRLVSNKTVVIKVNMTGNANYRLGHYPAELTHYTHPAVIGATVHLLGKAGARRIRIVESCWSTADPLEEVMLLSNWEPRHILNAAPRVDMENTNWLGTGKKYSRFTVPNGGYVFKHYDLNHSFEECDVFVSISKIKEHATAGVTLAMKNHFGSTPATIYGDGAGKDEPSEFPQGGRNMLHAGNRIPAGIAENDPKSPRDGSWRIPRIVADLCAARPIDLAINEGIESMAGGEGPWIRDCRYVAPGVIVAGTNAVCTDAVSTAVMGFDPAADRGTAPFERCDSTLRLGDDLGIGTRDLKRIEVVGVPVADARFPFRVSKPRT